MTKLIKLTKAEKRLNEEAKERLREVQEEAYEANGQIVEPTDENGRTAEFYMDLGMDVPEELQKKFDDTFEITFNLDKDYDLVEATILSNVDDWQEVEQGDQYTLITYKDGDQITVTNTLEEIEQLINK